MVKLNISDEILAEIGKIVVIHSLVEESLASIIGTIISLKTRHELGQVVTAELSFRQLISTLNSLLILCLGKEHECTIDFERIKKLLYDAEVQRNQVAHSLWAKHDESGSQVVLRIKTTAKEKVGLRREFTKLDIVEIRKITASVADAYLALCIFELRFQKDDPAMNEQLDSYQANL